MSHDLSKRLLIAVSLLIPAAADAVTQVSNLAEPLSVEFTSQGTFAHASSLTTGPAVVQLTSITVAVFTNSTGTSALRLRADNAGSPGTLIESLGSQTLPTAGSALLTFNSPGTPTLSANTTYWVTLGETGSGDLQWDGTTSTAQTSPASWTIGDQMMRSSNGGASWVDVNFGPPNESGKFAVDASAITATPPDLAVADFLFQAIFLVNDTGDRSILSGCADAACSTLVGTGPAFEGVYGLALDDDGSLLAVDGFGQNVMSVDSPTGNRAVLTGCANAACSSVVGSGINLVEPVDVMVLGSSQLLLSDFGSRAVLLVDGAGNRTALSGCADASCSSIVGSGRNLVGPGGVMRALPSGDIYVVDRPPVFTSGPVAVMKIDFTTGNRTVVSGCIDAGCTSIAGSGPTLSRPHAGFVHADGNLILTDDDLSAVIRIDPATGNRIEVSGPSVGSGPPFSSSGPIAGVAWVAPASDGSLFVTDIGLRSVFRVDPATGDRTVVSSSAVGTGPDFEAPIGLMLPEPRTIPGLAASVALLALLANRCRRTRAAHARNPAAM